VTAFYNAYIGSYLPANYNGKRGAYLPDSDISYREASMATYYND
jgi:hypothetical protein